MKAFGLACALVLAAALAAPAAAGAITTAEENLLAGSPDWQRPAATGRAIEGYTSQVSAVAGESLGLHVSTTPGARYRVDILRFGWYDGDGARRVACLPACDGDFAGTARPMPEPAADTGLIEAGWPEAVAIDVGADWTSGLYGASLVLTSGPQEGAATMVPFAVRRLDPPADALMVMLPVNTWQAYNSWGGKTLYAWGSDGGKRATKASFDRPWQTAGSPYFQYFPLRYEYPWIRFAERDGYELAYTTDVDVHRGADDLKRYRGVVSLGHGEYWSKEQRDAFEAARDAGVHLAFLGANQVHWQSRYEKGERTVVMYRTRVSDPVTDPERETIRFRHLETPRPECELMGVQWETGGIGHSGGEDYVVAPGALADPWMASSGFAEGDTLQDTIQIEWDERKPGCAVPALRLLFEYKDAETPAEAVHYTAPSGAEVFAAGSLGLTDALDTWIRWGVPPDPRLEAFMRAMLDDFVDRKREPPVEEPPPTDPPLGGDPPLGPVFVVPPAEERPFADPPADPEPPADLAAPAVRLKRADRRPLVTRAGRLTLRIGPPGETATGRVALRAGGRQVASAPLRLDAGEVAAVRLRLSRRGRALLARRRSLRAVAAVTLRDAAGNRATRRFVIRLRARSR